MNILKGPWRRAWCALCLCAPLYYCSTVHAEDDGGFVIAARKDEKPAPAAAPAEKKPPEPSEFAGLLGEGFNDAEFQAQMKTIVERVKRANLSDVEKADIVGALTTNPERSARALAMFLDWQRTPDVFLRIAAADTMKLATELPSKFLGGSLGASAMFDPNAQMRAASIQQIKDRNDRVAVGYVFRTMLKSMENGESTAISNTGEQAAAIAALKEIGCKQTYAALLYYAKVSKAQGITGSANLDGVKIPAPNVDLPITVANNEIGAFESVQTFPGLELLKKLTGEDFQNNYKKWQEWIDQQPNYKK